MSHETPIGLFSRAGEFLKRHARRPNTDVRAYTYSEILEIMEAFAAEVRASPPAAETGLIEELQKALEPAEWRYLRGLARNNPDGFVEVNAIVLRKLMAALAALKGHPPASKD